ncbi:hypothetical protein [Parasegetibacter sp. NRK P23]|uniref:hypothetical protein n=1 Tax=Parasegetibacter sp. NRK P23 TaxID=2942999 RepID=UPI0020432CEC|nr:hypothetical protein [Parasegetibacter sp. NRK P23]MCM5528946.1 hypothetical protein [Parasegetibacter sp. NRK P23]
MKKQLETKEREQHKALLIEMFGLAEVVFNLEESPFAIQTGLLPEMVSVFFASDHFANLPDQRREVLASQIPSLFALFDGIVKVENTIVDDHQLAKASEIMQSLTLA